LFPAIRSRKNLKQNAETFSDHEQFHDIPDGTGLDVSAARGMSSPGPLNDNSRSRIAMNQITLSAPPRLSHANGDLRLLRTKVWPEQAKMEASCPSTESKLGSSCALSSYGIKTAARFIDSQKMGLEVFRQLDPQRAADRANAFGNTAIISGRLLTIAANPHGSNWSGIWPASSACSTSTAP